MRTASFMDHGSCQFCRCQLDWVASPVRIQYVTSAIAVVRKLMRCDIGKCALDNVYSRRSNPTLMKVVRAYWFRTKPSSTCQSFYRSPTFLLRQALHIKGNLIIILSAIDSFPTWIAHSIQALVRREYKYKCARTTHVNTFSRAKTHYHNHWTIYSQPNVLGSTWFWVDSPTCAQTVKRCARIFCHSGTSSPPTWNA